MSDPALDLAEAHKHFSGACFNATWDLLDKTDRSDDESEEMLRLAQASLWHWTRRPDCGAMQRSVGYWLLSRVHAVRGEAAEARRDGERCLAESVDGDLPPFYRGCAYEALARAALVADGSSQEHAEASRHLEQARTCLDSIQDAEQRSTLEADLLELDGRCSP